MPLEKFTGYIFAEKHADNGKVGLYRNDFGYTIEDSEYLKAEFERQAREKYMRGEYYLKDLKPQGQLINIPIELTPPMQEATFVVTGWRVLPNGNIKCVTPYGAKRGK